VAQQSAFGDSGLLPIRRIAYEEALPVGASFHIGSGTNASGATAAMLNELRSGVLELRLFGRMLDLKALRSIFEQGFR
jgi:hypothetical protein